MSFPLAQLQTLTARHGRVARVVVAGSDGSVPREAGAGMLVWATGQSGTIGGGALEWQATLDARNRLTDTQSRFERIPLGPALGQCCGGAVRLLTEVFDTANLPDLPDVQDGALFARAVGGGDIAPPLSVSRLLGQLRSGQNSPLPRLLDGWFIECLQSRRTPLWIYGAGHVGRAIVQTISPLPEWSITWVDTAKSRYPNDICADVTPLYGENLPDLVQYAPQSAHHLILTYSHEIDLALCHALLGHDFGFAGVIGSATKWARFRKRLGALGHTSEQITRLTCPIGRPEYGKHPTAIAIGVAATLLDRQQRAAFERKTGS
jgi:xanthine dehydrogenase accessory factor